MATSTDENYVDYGEYIDFQLNKTQNQIKATDFFVAVIGIFTFLVFYLLIFTVLDHWVVPGGFSNGMRLALLTIITLISGAWVFYKVMIPFRKKIKTLFAARTIENSTSDLNNSLLNLINIEQSRDSVRGSIYRSMEKQAAVSLSETDISQVVDRKKLIQLSYSLLIAVVIFCTYALFSPKEISFWRPLVPFSAVDVSTITEILSVEPGDAEVLAQSELPVTVELKGKIPENVFLYYSTEDRQFVDERVELKFVDENFKRFKTTLNGVNGSGILQNMSYYIEAGDAVSKTYQISVNRPPTVTIQNINLIYPKYMRLSNNSQTEGNIESWEGTKVQLTAHTNTRVKSATLYFEDESGSTKKAEELRLNIQNGNILNTEWNLSFRSDGSFPKFYYIECKSEDNDKTNIPTKYSINIKPDQPPVIILKHPTTDLSAPTNGIIPLLVEASDPDFLLRSLYLHIEKNGQSLPAGIPLFDSELKKEVRIPFDWELEHLALNVGDELSFWIEARDNRQPTANKTNTPRLNIRITKPESEEEIQKDLEQEKKDQQEEHEKEQQKNEENQDDSKENNDKSQDQKPEKNEEGDSSQDNNEDTQDKSKNEDETQETGKSNKEGKQKGKSANPDDNQDGDPDPEGKKEGDQSDQNNESGSPTPKADDEQALQKMIQNYSDQGKNPDNNSDQKQKPKNKKQDSNKKQEPNNQNKEQSPEGSEDKPKERGKEDQPKNKPAEDSNNKSNNEKKSEEKNKSNQNKKPSDQEKNSNNDQENNSENDNPEEHNKSPKDDKLDQSKPNQEKPEKASSKKDSKSSKEKKDNQEPEKNKKEANEKNGENSETGNSKEQNKSHQSDDQKPSKKGDKKNKSEEGKNPDEDQSKNSPSEKAEKNKKPQPNDKKNGEDKNKQKTQKGTGDEKGKASSGDPDKESTKAKNELERKKDEKPSIKDKDANEKNEKNQTNQKKNEGQRNNSADQNKNKDQQNKQTKSEKNKNPKRGKSEQKKNGQKKQPEKNSKNSQKKTKPGDKPGKPGDKPGKPGDKPGKPGDKPGKPGDKPGKPGDKPGKPGDKPGKPGDKPGKPGDKPGKPGDKPGKPGDKPGGKSGKENKSNTGGKASKLDDQKPNNKNNKGGGKEAGQEQGNNSGKNEADGNEKDEANLDFNRKAANLVLKKLEDDLKRGKVDKNLLKELGWTEKDMAKFAERLRKQIANRKSDESPESVAKQKQFEEMLKNMRLKKGGNTRKEKPSGRVLKSDGFGGRKIPLPPQYRETSEAYSKEVSKGKK